MTFSYAPIDLENLTNPLIQFFSEEAKNTISSHASNENVRNDYAELNDLVLKFLGIHTRKPFKVPGGSAMRDGWLVQFTP